MSYSRWSNSFWYTYGTGSDTGLKKDEGFDVCGVAWFTYRQLTKNKTECLCKVTEKAKPPPTPSQVAELAGYMSLFIKETDYDYSLKGKILTFINQYKWKIKRIFA